jgi:hypothetical protein
MDDMIRLLLDTLVPDMAHGSEARIHPYTVDGRQVDVNCARRVG